MPVSPPRSDRLALVLLVALAVGVCIVRMAYTRTLPGPWFLPDEVIYIDHARQIASHGDLFYQGPITGVQPLWPVMLSPVERLLGQDPARAYVVEVGLSTLLGVLLAVPAYLIARRRLAPPEAAIASLVCIVLPGTCLYGWAVLTEPLFTLLVLTFAWLFLAAAGSGSTAYFGLSAVVACLSYWLRPTGLACVLAVLAGAVCYGISRRQWRVPCLVVAVAAVILGGAVCLQAAVHGRAAVTNYSDEAGGLRRMVLPLGHLRGWGTVGASFLRDVTYLLVATFGVFLIPALMAAGAGVRRFRSMDPRGRALVAGGAVLYLALLGITVVTQTSNLAERRMYGRYVAPLVPLTVVLGAMAWRFVADDAKRRRTAMVVSIVLAILLALLLPQGVLSFANNPDIWYWTLLCGWIGAMAAVAVLPILWLAASWARRRLGAVLIACGVLGCVSTGLVMARLDSRNHEMGILVKTAADAAKALRTESRPFTVWVDPSLLTGPSTQWRHFSSLLGHALPGHVVRSARQDQIVRAGDFLLTPRGRDDKAVVWRGLGVAIRRLERPSPTSTPSSRPASKPTSG